MKTIKSFTFWMNFLLFAIIGCAVFYGVFAFITLELNPIKWDEEKRVVYSIIVLILFSSAIFFAQFMFEKMAIANNSEAAKEMVKRFKEEFDENEKLRPENKKLRETINSLAEKTRADFAELSVLRAENEELQAKCKTMAKYNYSYMQKAAQYKSLYEREKAKTKK
jgi:regulator of replication initiation timing